jgi:hypothetical protein
VLVLVLVLGLVLVIESIFQPPRRQERQFRGGDTLPDLALLARRRFISLPRS